MWELEAEKKRDSEIQKKISGDWRKVCLFFHLTLSLFHHLTFIQRKERTLEAGDDDDVVEVSEKKNKRRKKRKGDEENDEVAGSAFIGGSDDDSDAHEDERKEAAYRARAERHKALSSVCYQIIIIVIGGFINSCG